jgi:hypothetical protein
MKINFNELELNPLEVGRFSMHYNGDTCLGITDHFLNNDHILQHILTIKTRGNFLWRLWFLISAPIIWLYKGTIKIK